MRCLVNIEPPFVLTESECRQVEEALEREAFNGGKPRLRFPDWVKMYRGRSAMSRPMLASGLFTFNRGPRAKYTRKEALLLESYSDGADIEFVGEELRQDDKRVLIYLVDRIRDKPVQATVVLNARDFVEGMGWSRESRSVEKLDESLSRMQASCIVLRRGFGFDSVQLVGRVVGDGLERRISMNESFAFLFDAGATYFPLADYRELTDGAATWMHGLLAAHRAETSFELKTLHALSRSKAGLATFGELVRDVMPRLLKAGIVGAYGFSRGRLRIAYDDSSASLTE